MSERPVNLTCASNRRLLDELKRALLVERTQTCQVLHLLAEVDRRRLYVEMGFSSLFTYCCEGLGLSSDQAYRRVAAARTGRRFPVVLALLETGELHMSGVAKLATFLTEDNHHSLIEQARGRTKAEIERLIAREFPGATAGPTVVSPSSETSYSFRFEASAKAKVLLDRAKQLSPPGTDVGEIFEDALAMVVERLERKKFKTADRPRTAPPAETAAGADHVPAAVKRTVHRRDDGRCTLRSPEGRRCSERSSLEFDHVVPRALGGQGVVANVRLRCRAHNLHAAEQVFGRRFMASKRREQQNRRRGDFAWARCGGAESRLGSGAATAPRRRTGRGPEGPADQDAGVDGLG